MSPKTFGGISQFLVVVRFFPSQRGGQDIKKNGNQNDNLSVIQRLL